MLWSKKDKLGLPQINTKHIEDFVMYPDVSRRIKNGICFMPDCVKKIHPSEINFHLCIEHLPYKYFNGGLSDYDLQQTIKKLMKTQQELRDEIDKIDENYDKISKEDQDKELEKHIDYLQDIQKNIDYYLYNRYYKTIIDKDPSDKGFRKVKIHNQFIDDIINKISFDYYFDNSPFEKESFSTELIPPFLTDEFLNLNERVQAQRLELFTRWVVFGRLLIYYNKKKGILQVYKLDNGEFDLDHIIYETKDKIVYVNKLSEDEFRQELLKQYEFELISDQFPTAEVLKKHRHILAGKYHPDKKGGSNERMQEINRICEILTNEDEFRSEYEQKPKIEVYIYDKTKNHILGASDSMIKNTINNIKDEIKIDRHEFMSMLTFGKDLVFHFPRIQMQLQDKMNKYNFKNQEKKTNLEDDLITIKNEYILTEYLVGSHHKSKSRYKFYKKKNKETISKVMFEDSAYVTKYNKGFLKAAIEFVKSKICNPKNKNMFNSDRFCVGDDMYYPFRYKKTVEDLPEFHVYNPLPDMYYRTLPDVNEILSKIEPDEEEEFCGLIYYFHPNDVVNNEYCYNKKMYSPEEFYDNYIFNVNEQVTIMHLYWWWYNVPEDIRRDIIELIKHKTPELYFLLLGNYNFKDPLVKRYFYRFFDKLLKDPTLSFGNQFGMTPFH